MELGEYRQQAEAFVHELDAEYYLHFSGRKEDYEVEPIYERHARLFDRTAVESLRGAGCPPLLEFAVHGLIGRATAAEQAEAARREASLEIEAAGRTYPFRQAAIEQAREPDPGLRAAIEAARLEATEGELNPLLREAHERSAALAAELGWESMRALCEQLAGLDLARLAGQTDAFLDASEPVYEPLLEPEIAAQLRLSLDSFRRSDIPAFLRAPTLDRHFPDDRLHTALHETASGLGIYLDRLDNVIVDAESRPRKSPRAFCAPVRVPDEVYLVIAPTGGRDDYETMLHEAGHALHYGHVDRGLAFESRYLGDNSVTEGFAFLLQGLAADPDWLRARLGIEDPGPVVRFARASKALFLRRYCAKLAYELELHGPAADLDEMPALYSELLGRAVRVEWPPETWLADVDAFFYVARYLRAWALETHLRGHLRERFGPSWFAEPEAGALLRELWREGQRRDADELLADLTGGELEFSVMLAELRSDDRPRQNEPPGQGAPA